MEKFKKNIHRRKTLGTNWIVISESQSMKGLLVYRKVGNYSKVCNNNSKTKRTRVS